MQHQIEFFIGLLGTATSLGLVIYGADFLSTKVHNKYLQWKRKAKA